MLSNRSNPPLCQVPMFNTSPISRKCDITVRTCKLLRHIIALEEIDRNCLQLSYALFFGLIHISLTFSERDVGTALAYRDKNHFGASISRKTNFKSSIWKWQRRHFRKLLEVARFSLRDVTMAKIVRTNKLPSSPPPPALMSNGCVHYQFSCALKLARKCEIEHWFSCGADGRAGCGRCTVTWLPNFLGWVDLLTHGAPQARFVRQSSAMINSMQKDYQSQVSNHMIWLV